MKKIIAIHALLFCLFLAPAAAQERPHVALGQTAEALQADFNEHTDKVRVIILLSPT